MISSDRRHELFGRVERATEVPMLVLAVLFLVNLVIQELAPITPEQFELLEAVSWFIWAIFAFELVLKTYLAPARLAYLRAHWIDVLTVIVPFLRPLRLLLIVTIGARFWEEARTVLKNRTFSVLSIAGLLAVAISALSVYYAERGGDGPIQSLPDAVWWAMVTVTTVGYGDFFPKSPIGRGVAVVLMLIGISLFGLLTARVAAFFVESDENPGHDPKLDEVLARLASIEAQLRAATLSTAPGELAAPDPVETPASRASLVEP